MAAMLILAGLVGGAWWMTRLDARVRTYLSGPAVGTMRIMAAPKTLAVGAPVNHERLAAVLARLGYIERDEPLATRGEFRHRPDGMELWQRHAELPWRPARHHARVTLADDHVARITDLDVGGDIARLEFVPEPLAVGGAAGAVLEATGERVPTHCRQAVLASEDRLFFRHPGVNPIAIARAFVTNLMRGEIVQGGSTITQQLVKNAFLSPRRTYTRKLREAGLALLLEAHTTKEEILGRYLASVYLGADGGVPIHGLAQGALVHLGKPVHTLDVSECALLAGMIPAPNRYAPRSHPERARARRDEVLERMVASGFLDGPAAVLASVQPVQPAPAGSRAVAALYVADQVRRELGALLPGDLRHSPGLTVYTSVDADTQYDAERAIREGLAGLERRYQHLQPGSLQGSLVAIDPANGRIRALVGGRDYRRSQLDRVGTTRRQPGSTFKPFVYLSAIDPARAHTQEVRTVASLLDDAPLQLRVSGRLWQPANYDGTYHGRVLLADALAHSMNTATIRLALAVGVQNVIETAHRLGIHSELPAVPSLALGTAEVSLLELTSAYTVLASGGIRHPPATVMAVTSADGAVLYVDARDSERVLDPGVAYLGTYLLEQVIANGTGHGARAAGVRGAAAGKTGTTDKARDAWFVGFTPDLAAGVWVGRDDAKPTGLGGSRGALPIWSHFVREVSARYAPRDFPVPDEIVWFDVDPDTGLLAVPACPTRRRMPFVYGTAPTRPCPAHARIARPHEPDTPRRSPARGFADWFRGLFR